MSNQVAQTSSHLLASSVSNAGAQLGINYMRNLSRNQKENVVISPISIQIILNMILLGAKLDSQTEQELIKHIGYEEISNKSANKDKPHEGMHQVSELLAESVGINSKLKFDLANLILLKEQSSPEYLKSVEKFYRNTRFEQVSNKTNESELKQRVNSWVAAATKNHITRLADGLNLNPANLLMVLINAAFFQGEWLDPFPADQTTDQVFYNHGLENQTKKVKFMQQSDMIRSIDFTPITQYASRVRDEGPSEAELNYIQLAKKLNCRAISLPFSANKGKELDMIIVLPNKRDGLAGLLSNLTDSDLKMIFKEIDEEPLTRVRVAIPKFSFETMFDVESAMKAMGASKIFTDSAELNRMYPKHPAYVSQILHKAKISVDEKGAEAAAATVAVVSMRSGRPSIPPFKADHPFLFVIRHKPSGMPAFMGSVIMF